jgi:IS605 OrfB family transposase
VATVDVPAVDLGLPKGFIGVDMGVANIATQSDAARHGGRGLQRHRKRMRGLRTKLRKKNTKSAKRRARLLSGRESQWARDLNHCISKSIVVEAERTGHGIGIEDLRGIRDQVRLKRPQRTMVRSWTFAQLGQFLAYKAERYGVLLVAVDPRNSSRECPQGHHIDKRNRPSQARFRCGGCGFADHACRNAFRNLSQRGWWRLVCGVPSMTASSRCLFEFRTRSSTPPSVAREPQTQSSPQVVDRGHEGQRRDQGRRWRAEEGGAAVDDQSDRGPRAHHRGTESEVGSR